MNAKAGCRTGTMKRAAESHRTPGRLARLRVGNRPSQRKECGKVAGLSLLSSRLSHERFLLNAESEGVVPCPAAATGHYHYAKDSTEETR